MDAPQFPKLKTLVVIISDSSTIKAVSINSKPSKNIFPRKIVYSRVVDPEKWEHVLAPKGKAPTLNTGLNMRDTQLALQSLPQDVQEIVISAAVGKKTCSVNLSAMNANWQLSVLKIPVVAIKKTRCILGALVAPPTKSDEYSFIVLDEELNTALKKLVPFKEEHFIFGTVARAVKFLSSYLNRNSVPREQWQPIRFDGHDREANGWNAWQSGTEPAVKLPSIFDVMKLEDFDVNIRSYAYECVFFLYQLEGDATETIYQLPSAVPRCFWGTFPALIPVIRDPIPRDVGVSKSPVKLYRLSDDRRHYMIKRPDVQDADAMHEWQMHAFLKTRTVFRTDYRKSTKDVLTNLREDFDCYMQYPDNTVRPARKASKSIQPVTDFKREPPYGRYVLPEALQLPEEPKMPEAFQLPKVYQFPKEARLPEARKLSNGPRSGEMVPIRAVRTASGPSGNGRQPPRDNPGPSKDDSQPPGDDPEPPRDNSQPSTNVNREITINDVICECGKVLALRYDRKNEKRALGCTFYRSKDEPGCSIYISEGAPDFKVKYDICQDYHAQIKEKKRQRGIAIFRREHPEYATQTPEPETVSKQQRRQEKLPVDAEEDLQKETPESPLSRFVLGQKRPRPSSAPIQADVNNNNDEVKRLRQDILALRKDFDAFVASQRPMVDPRTPEPEPEPEPQFISMPANVVAQMAQLFKAHGYTH